MKTLITRFRNQWFLRSFLTIVLTPGLVLFPVAINANPSGAAVAAGTVNFDGMGTGNLTINQSSQTAIINWQDFSIGTGDTTTFVQPNASALAVNRVVSGNVSAIYGQLNANGRVMVINPNGIIVGANGMIDVNALTLSTLDASNADLLNGGANRFQGNTGKGVTVEAGASIYARQDVVVLGNFMNNDGSIVADRKVAIGVGGDIMVNQTSDGATISVRGAAPAAATGIENSGTIQGGDVSFDAHGNSYAMAINNKGTVRASGYNFKGGRLSLSAGSTGRMVNTGNYYARQGDGRGGQVQVTAGEVNLASGRVDASGAEGRDGGSVSVSAETISVGADTTISTDGVRGGSVTLDAADALNVAGDISSTGSLKEGGKVDLVGDVVTVAASSSVDVSGFSGGAIRAGGGIQGNEGDIRNSGETVAEAGATLTADGLSGDGGTVVVWSDGDTLFAADASARATGSVGNGGFIEVSGRNQLSYVGSANTSSLNGANGTLLLDPSDVIIGPAGGTGLTMTDAALLEAILTNHVVIHTSSTGTGSGDIIINSGSDIQYDSPNSLSFFAHRHIFVNGDIKNHGTTDTAFAGTGNINLVAGWDGAGADLFAFNPVDGSGLPSAADPAISFADINAGTYGAWGQDSGTVFMNDAALEPVEVGSARGETNVFADILLMTSGNHNGEFTQLGYRRENDLRARSITGLGADGDIGTADDILINTATDLDFDTGVTGDINVDAESGVFVIQNQNANNDDGIKSNDRAYVMIGHGGIRENDDDIDNRAFNTNGGNNNNRNEADVTRLENSALGFSNFTNGASIANGNSFDIADYGSDAGNTSVGNGDNHGNITIRTNGTVQLQAGRAESHAQIGHGGLANDDPDRRRDQTASDSGLGDNNVRNIHVFGNMSGDITIDAGAVDIEGGRYRDTFAMIGHGGTRIRGEHSGDIKITTISGGIRARAVPDSATGGPANSNDWRWQSNRDRSHVQVGHGGYDSDFLFLDSLAGWNGTSTDSSVVVSAANRDRGAYDTSGNVARPDDPDAPFMDARPRRTVTLNTNDPDGGGALVAGANTVNNSSYAGDGIAINRIRGRISDDAGVTVNGIAGGVTNEAFGHSGDISLNSASTVTFVAGNGTDAYAMVGHGGRSTHGDHVGDISVIAGGSIVFSREAWQVNERGRDITNRGHRAHVQIGHGGTRYNGGSTGDIEVISGRNVEFYGGRSESYAQVGHGGRGEDSSTWRGGRQRNEIANGTHSGDINVVAARDIIFRSGFKNGQAHSLIGHGGYFQHADVLETNHLTGDGVGTTSAPFGGGATNANGDLDVLETGHHGNITVTSGGDISFVAGQTETLTGQSYMEENGNDNFTMIGHGGRFSKGNHYGEIDVTATGDFNLEARGGWDAVSFNNAGNTADNVAAPMLNSAQDNSRTAERNFAQLGHGGSDSEHIATNGTSNWNNSGVNGDGIGVLGASDITLDVGGDITALAAMRDTTGDKPLQIRILQDNGAGNPNIGNVQNTYVTEGQVVFQGPGAVAGLDSEIVLMAPTAVTLNGDGTLTVQELVDVHNTANPLNQITILGGDATQVPDAGAALAFSTSVTPDRFFSQHGGRFQQITRSDTDTSDTSDNGEVWYLPNAVYSAIDSYVQIGNGGRATDYIGSGGTRNGGGGSIAGNSIDGLGHRGDIDIQVGGDIRVEASDIKQSVSSGQLLPIQVLSGMDAGVANNPAVTNNGDGTGWRFIGPAVGGTNSNFIRNDGVQNDPSQGTRNYAMIGLGGDTARGDHSGTISIIGDGDNSNGGDFSLIAGEGRQAFAQVGSGGYDSDRVNSDNQRDGDTGATTTIDIDIDGRLDMQGGGLQNGDTTGEVATLIPGLGVHVEVDNDITRGSYVQIGSGGFSNGGNHHADINIITGTGVNLEAGDSPRGAYGIIGSGGTWGRSETLSGDISVVAETGDITLTGGIPSADTEDDPNSGPANSNNVAVARENYAQIGNGGFDTDAQGGNQNNAAGDGSGYSGDITVIAANGSVSLQGGGSNIFNRDDQQRSGGTGNDSFRAFYAKIGNGGPYSDGDASGNIKVTAGTDLTLLGGFGSRRSEAQIGHGGNNVNGDLTGTIDIDVGNDLVMQRGSTVDAHGTVVRDANAKIGHSASIFQGNANNGSGGRTGDIFVSVGQDIFMANGVNLFRASDEDLSAIGAGGTATLAGPADPDGGAVAPNAFGIAVESPSGGDTLIHHYGDDGNGNIVLIAEVLNVGSDTNTDNDTVSFPATRTVVGTINYATGEVELTSDITEGSTATSILAEYAMVSLEETDFGAQIGHIDLANTNAGVTIGADGDTLIAASRNNPTGNGTDAFGAPLPVGSVTMSSGTVLTSADGGLTTDLRIYMPSATENAIEDGAFLNNQEYSRTDSGGVGNRDGIDEQVATEHFFTADTTGAFGEPGGTFFDPPEGSFPFHSLGLYNVYYADPTSLPPVPPVPPGPAPVDPLAVLAQLLRDDPFFLDSGFDAYDRADLFAELFGEGSEEYLALIELFGLSTEGGEAVGNENAWVGPLFDAGDLNAEVADEERRRALLRVGGRTYYLFGFNENTRIYSSLRLFGSPYGE